MPDDSFPAPAVDIRSLRVDYGDFVAVNDLTLSIPAGEILGLVGPNGAGKTSTFKVLATLQEPTYGEVNLCGVDILDNREAARRIIGYMPDLAPVPPDLTIREFLEFYAQGYLLGSQAERSQRVDECLALVNLLDKQASWCQELSRGQTQRVVLAKTLLHRPKVLILDEPASGLDPLARRDLKLALRKIASEGATVIVSSHILSELAEMCSSIFVMNRGQLLASGTPDQVREQLGNTKRTLTITPLGPVRAVADWLSSHPMAGLENARLAEASLLVDFHGSDEAQAQLLENLLLAGIRLRAFSEQRTSFEDLLVDVAESNRK